MSEHTFEPWGIEQTREMLWVGPMRPDGHKVDQVVVGLAIGVELTPTAALRQFHNARLIAAAPTLLAACREAADLCVGTFAEGGSPHKRFLAAIQQATGAPCE